MEMKKIYKNRLQPAEVTQKSPKVSFIRKLRNGSFKISFGGETTGLVFCVLRFGVST